jgi:hypothetical protein
MFFDFCSAEDLKFCLGGLFYINYEAIPVNEQNRLYKSPENRFYIIDEQENLEKNNKQEKKSKQNKK